MTVYLDYHVEEGAETFCSLEGMHGQRIPSVSISGRSWKKFETIQERGEGGPKMHFKLLETEDSLYIFNIRFVKDGIYI